MLELSCRYFTSCISDGGNIKISLKIIIAIELTSTIKILSYLINIKLINILLDMIELHTAKDTTIFFQDKI